MDHTKISITKDECEPHSSAMSSNNDKWDGIHGLYLDLTMVCL